MTGDKTRNLGPEENDPTVPLSEPVGDVTVSMDASSSIDALERPGTMIGHCRLE